MGVKGLWTFCKGTEQGEKTVEVLIEASKAKCCCLSLTGRSSDHMKTTRRHVGAETDPQLFRHHVTKEKKRVTKFKSVFSAFH